MVVSRDVSVLDWSGPGPRTAGPNVKADRTWSHNRSHNQNQSTKFECEPYLLF